MSQQHQIPFDDGDAYERGMSPWSRLAGRAFLDWMAPPENLRWLDVGCGTGAFTELIVERCAPLETQGIDPQNAQLAIARSRLSSHGASFRVGDAMELPFKCGRFDAAVMALVLFFVPDPARGVAEMARVVRPGGLIAAYAWDVLGSGFPFDPIWVAIRAAGGTPLLPPRPEVADVSSLHALWLEAGLQAVETYEITVERKFASFEDYWERSTITGGIRRSLESLPLEVRERLKVWVRERLTADRSGGVRWRARANAIKGRVAA